MRITLYVMSVRILIICPYLEQLFSLILSYLILPHLIQSYLDYSYLTLFYLTLSNLILHDVIYDVTKDYGPSGLHSNRIHRSIHSSLLCDIHQKHLLSFLSVTYPLKFIGNEYYLKWWKLSFQNSNFASNISFVKV